MKDITDIQEFVNLPDTISFTARYNGFYQNFVRDKGYVHDGTQITGDRIISYISVSDAESVLGEIAKYVSLPVIVGLMDSLALEASGITQVKNQPFLNLTGQGVLLGFVDTGIEYTKENFIYEDGTSKVKYLWDQSIIGTPPDGFYSGTEYINQQINTALKSENPYEIVPSRDTSGHGTFLASVAGGRENDGLIGAAPDSDFIVVKLKKAHPFYLEKYLVPKEQENAFESSDVMLGIEYILQKALQLNRPVSICLGLGTNLGSHDGSSALEEYLSIVCRRAGVCVSVAAGNESQARHHTQGLFAKTGQLQNIDVKVGEKSSDIHMSIWKTVPDKISVSIKSPTGEIVGRVPPKSGTTVTSKLVLENATVVIDYMFPNENGTAQEVVVKIISPTPGIWSISLQAEIIVDGNYHCWLPITGFISPETEFLTPTPNFTVVVPATASGVITTGAYDHKTKSLYVNTSWGPSRLPALMPDLVAPGVNVDGVYPTGEGTMSGTSVSTAITAGAGALMLQWGVVFGNEPSINTYRIRASFIRGCDRDPSIEYPSLQWGYGRLNLLQSFNLMRET